MKVSHGISGHIASGQIKPFDMSKQSISSQIEMNLHYFTDLECCPTKLMPRSLQENLIRSLTYKVMDDSGIVKRGGMSEVIRDSVEDFIGTKWYG